MTIKMTYLQLDNRDLHEALALIDNCTVLSVKTMCQFNKFKKTFDAEYKTFLDMARKIFDKYLIKDKDGKVEGAPQFTDVAAKDKEMGELWEQEFTVEINPIKMADILSAKPSPKQIRSLGVLLTDTEEGEDSGPKLVKNK